ncbi:MAG: hypothetical protein GEU28_11395 [Dehalococcoidia bacterium]|nr:hypothetical protein [Dehalococcoidia bacterium]
MNKPRRFPAALGLSLIALVVIGTAAVAGYVASQSGDDATTEAGNPNNPRATPTSSPTAEPTRAGEGASPTPTPTATSTPAPGSANGALVYAEFGEQSDRIVSFDPASGTASEVAAVPHFPNYGITGSVSSRGAVAFLSVPTDLNSANVDQASYSQSELWLIPPGGSPALLTAGVDVRQAPVWNNAGDAVAVRSVTYDGDGPAESARIDLVGADGTARNLVSRSNVNTIAALGFNEGGDTLYFAETAAGGVTIIQRVDVESGAVSEVARGGDYIELISWRVGNGQLAAIVLEPQGDAEALRRVVTIDLESGSRSLPERSDAIGNGNTFSPAWGRELSFAAEAGASARGVVVLGADGVRQLAQPGSGFDAPIAWTRDGSLLAGLHFEQFPPARAGSAFILLSDGGRVDVPADAEVTILGWR